MLPSRVQPFTNTVLLFSGKQGAQGAGNEARIIATWRLAGDSEDACPFLEQGADGGRVIDSSAEAPWSSGLASLSARGCLSGLLLAAGEAGGFRSGGQAGKVRWLLPLSVWALGQQLASLGLLSCAL